VKPWASIAGFLIVASPAACQTPDLDQRTRLQAQVQELNTALMGNNSATAVLQGYCDRLGANIGRIRARKAPVSDDPRLAGAARRQLGVGPKEPIRHRRVELVCGEIVLSRADNWYLPNRLTQQMNTTLQSTERPFGVVVAPLGFHRRTLAVRVLFEPLPTGWETERETYETRVGIPADILQHRAVLQARDGRPFSYVVETYTDQILR
jgi:chorismate-pyruvate lyase